MPITALGVFMAFSIECTLSTWQIFIGCASECSLQPGNVPILKKKKKHRAKHIIRGWILVLLPDNLSQSTSFPRLLIPRSLCPTGFCGQKRTSPPTGRAAKSLHPFTAVQRSSRTYVLQDCQSPVAEGWETLSQSPTWREGRVWRWGQGKNHSASPSFYSQKVAH